MAAEPKKSGGRFRRPKKSDGPKAQRIGNRWAGPAMVVSAVVGLVWIVTWYTIGDQIHIPWFSDLGSWNLVIGMGFIMAAFGFAMKWE